MGWLTSKKGPLPNQRDAHKDKEWAKRYILDPLNEPEPSQLDGPGGSSFFNPRRSLSLSYKDRPSLTAPGSAAPSNTAPATTAAIARANTATSTTAAAAATNKLRRHSGIPTPPNSASPTRQPAFEIHHPKPISPGRRHSSLPPPEWKPSPPVVLVGRSQSFTASTQRPVLPDRRYSHSSAIRDVQAPVFLQPTKAKPAATSSRTATAKTTFVSASSSAAFAPASASLSTSAFLLSPSPSSSLSLPPSPLAQTATASYITASIEPAESWSKAATDSLLAIKKDPRPLQSTRLSSPRLRKQKTLRKPPQTHYTQGTAEIVGEILADKTNAFNNRLAPVLPPQPPPKPQPPQRVSRQPLTKAVPVLVPPLPSPSVAPIRAPILVSAEPAPFPVPRRTSSVTSIVSVRAISPDQDNDNDDHSESASEVEVEAQAKLETAKPQLRRSFSLTAPPRQTLPIQRQLPRQAQQANMFRGKGEGEGGDDNRYATEPMADSTPVPSPQHKSYPPSASRTRSDGALANTHAGHARPTSSGQDRSTGHKHRSSRSGRNSSRPLADTIDRLDPIGGTYHHGGPYDATLAQVNRNKARSPLDAVKQSNMEALRATPREYIADSLTKHMPLQGTGTIPPGMPDLSGRIMHYREGADLMREPDAAGGAYKRYDFIEYHPDDLKGKGPAFLEERALAQNKQHKPRHSGRQLQKASRRASMSMVGSGSNDQDGYELLDRSLPSPPFSPRLRSRSHNHGDSRPPPPPAKDAANTSRQESRRTSMASSSGGDARARGWYRDGADGNGTGYSNDVDADYGAVHRSSGTPGKRFAEGIKRRFGSLRRK